MEGEGPSIRSALPEEELPTYEEVMQNESRYRSINQGAVSGVPDFPENSSSTSDSDSNHESMYHLHDQPRNRDYGHHPLETIGRTTYDWP